MSKAIDELKVVAEELKKDGWDLRASVYYHAVERMQGMEDLIVELMEVE